MTDKYKVDFHRYKDEEHNQSKSHLIFDFVGWKELQKKNSFQPMRQLDMRKKNTDIKQLLTEKTTRGRCKPCSILEQTGESNLREIFLFVLFFLKNKITPHMNKPGPILSGTS